MKRSAFTQVIVFAVALLLVPMAANAQPDQTNPQPPIAQPLVREGALAMSLVESLKLGTASDEVEAESMLGAVGIAPRNGWIADYPVTPDIIGELQAAVSDAAEASRIAMGKDDALKALQDATTALNMSVIPYTSGESYESTPPAYENYPSPSAVNDYYYNEGPPVVTYYAPPPNYYYLYNWVPYPFWWSSFWFPGFFVLHDFHKVVIVNKKPFFVTNHFNDFRTHRVFRIDPVHRFRGRTFAGIGAPSRRGFISTGVPRGSERIFNRGRGPERVMPGGGRAGSPRTGGRMTAPPSGGGGERMMRPPSGGGRGMGSPQGGRSMGSPQGGRGMGPSSGGERRMSPSSGGSRGPSGGGQRR